MDYMPHGDPGYSGQAPPLPASIESAADAVAVVDGAGVIVQVNAQVERLFGHARDALVGQVVETLIPERFRARHAKHRRAYFEAPIPRFMNSGVSLPGLHRDGRELRLDIALTPLPSAHGLLVACVFRELIDEPSHDVAMQQRIRELEGLSRRKDESMAILAHELRGPLSVIGHGLYLLDHPASQQGVKERALATMRAQTGHMQRLVEALLDLRQVRGGRVILDRSLMDLSEVIVAAVDAAQPLCEGRHQSLHVDVSPLCVVGDRTRLLQVVSNVLTNATRYTPDGGNIWLSLRREREDAVLRIRDDGIGIEQDMLTRVFEPFTRTASAQAASAEGLGIGLALVKSLVQMHGGEVVALSEGAGTGTEVVVRLPLVDCPTGPVARSTALADGGPG